MKFLIDAQLPRRFAVWLTEAGHDARHTLDLPLGNRTPDSEIIACATREKRIVVTKDDDFVQSFLIAGQPSHLLLVSTGNIANLELESLVRANLPIIEAAFGTHRFVEIGRETLAIHE
jgi:predicted nuclease of predicted toxin-antitoxin system